MARSLVIFVHGLFSGSDTWNAVNHLLSDDAAITKSYDIAFLGYRTPRFRFNTRRRIPDFNVLADRLSSLVSLESATHDKIVLVGHSQGGLIIQRFLARQLGEGRGQSLSQISAIVLFACPNNGSEFFLTLRRALFFWGHSQERELRPLAEMVSETQRRILSDVVYATSVTDHRCPIYVSCYAGDEDAVVSAVSARSFFPVVGGLPGDHSSIVRPKTANDPMFRVLRQELLDAHSRERPSPESTARPGAEADETSQFHTELTIRGPVRIPLDPQGIRTAVVNVQSGPVDQIRDVDVVATSENIYMQMAMTFKPSVSGRLRRAAARKGPAGEIIDDTANHELDSWMRQHGRFGLPVEPGTVAATSAGDLETRGVKRLYHAAIGIPVLGTDKFSVQPFSVAQAVHNVFLLARVEREEFNLSSIALPLFGAGLGSLPAEVSFEWMWRAAIQELSTDDSWVLHFLTWSTAETEMVLAALQRFGPN